MIVFYSATREVHRLQFQSCPDRIAGQLALLALLCSSVPHIDCVISFKSQVLKGLLTAAQDVLTLRKMLALPYFPFALTIAGLSRRVHVLATASQSGKSGKSVLVV